VGLRENNSDAWSPIQQWLLQLRRRGLAVRRRLAALCSPFGGRSTRVANDGSMKSGIGRPSAALSV
jgi:hypothetical protein